MSLRIDHHDDDICTLIQVTMDMIQRTLTRIYAVVEHQKRPLANAEKIELKTFTEFLVIANSDATDLGNKGMN